MYKRILSIAKTAYFDLRYSRSVLSRPIPTRFAETGAHDSSNSDYGALFEIFRACNIAINDVLMDVGCGKGRVISFWLSQKLKNTIYGVELDPEIANNTAQRFKHFSNVKIFAGDITQIHIPENITLFYLYSPFNLTVMKKFKDTIDSKFGIRIVYYNPDCISIFQRDPSWRIALYDLEPQSRKRHRFAILAKI